MTEKPLVSVIINCYNGEKYLREAIDSVIAQTYENWELVFWDNQSTDSTREIVESYNDARINYILATSHTSLGEARNEAMKCIEGAFACFLDSDDVWEPDFLLSTVGILCKDVSVGLVYTSYKYIGQKEGTHKSGKEGIRDYSSLLEDYDVALSGAVFRHSVQKDNNIWFDSSFNLIEDLDFFSKICLYKNAFHVGLPYLCYRIHENNLSSKTTQWYNEFKVFYDGLLALNSEGKDISRGVQAIKIRMINSLFIDSLNANDSFIKTFYYACLANPFKTKLSYLLALVKKRFDIISIRFSNFKKKL